MWYTHVFKVPPWVEPVGRTRVKSLAMTACEI